MTTLPRQLGQLEAADLIRLSAREPELEYGFRHALVQDAAYQSLVRSSRKVLHRQVGDVLERLYPQRRDELAPILADHFARGGDDPRALAYFTLAGDRAASRYANAEAVQHYTDALTVAGRSGCDGAQLGHLYGARGRALELVGRYAEALRNYEVMQTTAQERGDGSLELAALTRAATVRCIPTPVFDEAEGRSLSDRALALARSLGDRAVEAKILWNLMLLYTFSMRVADAVAYGEQSLAIARELNLREQIALTLNDLARACGIGGELPRGLAVGQESVGLLRELGNLPMLADSLGTINYFYLFRGEYAPLLANAREALRISQAIGNLWGQSFSQLWVGAVYAEQGEPARALAVMDECVRLGEQAGFVQVRGIISVHRALLLGELGALPRAMAIAQEGLAALAIHMPPVQALMLLVKARLHGLNNEDSLAEENWYSAREVSPPAMLAKPILPIETELAFARGDYPRAIATADAYLALSRATGFCWRDAHALWLKGKALRAQAQLDAARAVLLEARGEAELKGARMVLWQILLSLSEVETLLGGDGGALRRQAHEIVVTIAAQLDGTELRESFLRLARGQGDIN